MHNINVKLILKRGMLQRIHIGLMNQLIHSHRLSQNIARLGYIFRSDSDVTFGADIYSVVVIDIFT